LPQGIDQPRHQNARHPLVNQHRIQRVADRRSLDLGVANHFNGLLQVSAFVHVKMADANAAGDDRDGGVFTAVGVQSCAAARDEHINKLVHLQQLADQVARLIINKLHNPRVDFRAFQRVADAFHQDAVAVNSFAAAAKDDCVAAL